MYKVKIVKQTTLIKQNVDFVQGNQQQTLCQKVQLVYGISPEIAYIDY